MKSEEEIRERLKEVRATRKGQNILFLKGFEGALNWVLNMGIEERT